MLGLLGALAGPLIGGVMNMMGQNSANQMNLSLDSTKYQRATQDMTKAGLNPAMMYGTAGTPSGAPVMQNTMGAPAAALKDMASSATQQMIAQKTIDQLTEQIAKTNAETVNVKAGTPAIIAGSDIASREADAVKRIPSKVYIPLVQGGYGASKMAPTGRIGSIAGAGAASAKSVADGVVSLGPSGPALSSAKASFNDLRDAWKRKSPALMDVIAKHLKPYPRRNTTVIYKQ